MTLKWPSSNQVFNPNPGIFLGGFSIYDREESLGELLNQYNPNNPEHVDFLLDEYFFLKRHISIEFNIEHKKAIESMLSEHLVNETNFGIYFEPCDEDCFYLPVNWKFESPKQFYILVYRGIIKNWAHELVVSGVNLLTNKQLNEL